VATLIVLQKGIASNQSGFLFHRMKLHPVKTKHNCSLMSAEKTAMLFAKYFFVFSFCENLESKQLTILLPFSSGLYRLKRAQEKSAGF
jgi:hypothetical protein